MNLGQMLLIVGALFLLSLKLIKIKSTLLQTTFVTQGSKFGIFATPLLNIFWFIKAKCWVESREFLPEFYYRQLHSSQFRHSELTTNLRNI